MSFPRALFKTLDSTLAVDTPKGMSIIPQAFRPVVNGISHLIVRSNSGMVTIGSTSFTPLSSGGL